MRYSLAPLVSIKSVIAGIPLSREFRYLQAVADEIDDRPRVILEFRTSAEASAEFLADNPGDNIGSIVFHRLRPAIQKGPEK
jgi:hypothetical protein